MARLSPDERDELRRNFFRDFIIEFMTSLPEAEPVEDIVCVGGECADNEDAAIYGTVIQDRLDNKREYNPWTGKKRSEFNPWTGKRSGPEFNPWTGRRKRSIGAFYRSGAGKSEADSG